MNFIIFPQLSSEDVSASLGEESLQEDREEEQQESEQAPHPAGRKQTLSHGDIYCSECSDV